MQHASSDLSWPKIKEAIKLTSLRLQKAGKSCLHQAYSIPRSAKLTTLSTDTIR